jgi:hypothetical protein
VDEGTVKSKPSNVTTGNPRIAVAFPFSKIEIRDSEPVLSDLAGLIQRLAVQVAAMAHDVDEERADDADALVDEAAELAARLA